MAATDYCTLDELQAHLTLGSTNEYNAKLEGVIASVSRWIDSFCQRHFYQDGTSEEPVSRVFDTCNGGALGLSDNPVTVGGVSLLSEVLEVTEVATDDNTDGTYENVWSAGDYQLRPLNTSPARGIVALGRRFPSSRNERSGLIRVSGVWGWPSVPDGVREACLVQAARVFKRKESPEGVSGFDQFGIIRVSNRPDADVAALLNPLVHPAVAVLVG